MFGRSSLYRLEEGDASTRVPTPVRGLAATAKREPEQSRRLPQRQDDPMVPLVGVPETIRCGLAPYRDVFCRAEGFDHISRYVTGLILSPNKTLQGIL